MASVKHWRDVAMPVCGSTLFFWQLRHPFIRFAWPVVNDLAGFALGLGLPWLAFVGILRYGRRATNALAIAAFLPLLLYSAIFLLGSLITGLSYTNGHDLSFDRFAEASWRASNIRLYRTNGGATTAYGVVMRQERRVIPGVNIVRNIVSFYPCVSIDVIPSATGVTIKRSYYCDSSPEPARQYRLKPFVYF